MIILFTPVFSERLLYYILAPKIIIHSLFKNSPLLNDILKILLIQTKKGHL